MITPPLIDNFSKIFQLQQQCAISRNQRLTPMSFPSIYKNVQYLYDERDYDTKCIWGKSMKRLEYLKERFYLNLL